MSAELLRQKELEGAHRPQLLEPEAALRPPDGAEALLVLRPSSAPRLALPPQAPPGSPTPPREPARRAPRRGSLSPAAARPSEPQEATGAGLWVQDGSEDEPPKDSDGEDPEMVAVGGRGPTPAGGASSEGKGFLSGSLLPPSLPLSVPCVSPYLHTGGRPNAPDPSVGAGGGEETRLPLPLREGQRGQRAFLVMDLDKGRGQQTGGNPGKRQPVSVTPPPNQAPWGDSSVMGRRPRPLRTSASGQWTMSATLWGACLAVENTHG